MASVDRISNTLQNALEYTQQTREALVEIRDAFKKLEASIDSNRLAELEDNEDAYATIELNFEEFCEFGRAMAALKNMLN